jgi:uncharacterized protein (DUF433 family)
MNRFDRITVNPAVVSGQPCIRGMRLTVKRVLEAVARNTPNSKPRTFGKPWILPPAASMTA